MMEEGTGSFSDLVDPDDLEYLKQNVYVFILLSFFLFNFLIFINLFHKILFFNQRRLFRFAT